MVRKVPIVIITMVFLASFNSTASASLISLDTAGVVGAIKGVLDNANPDTEMVAAQRLLRMLPSAHDPVACDIMSLDGCYARSSTAYSATALFGPFRSVEPNDYTVGETGYEFALAKYDGKQGGYVLFYIGGNAVVLPEFPYPIWGGDNEEKYKISHYTLFNSNVDEGPTPYSAVPDGGSTLLMLGAALGGFGFVRRRIKA